MDNKTLSVSNALKPFSGLDGWVEVEDQDFRDSDLSSNNSGCIGSNVRPAALTPRSGISLLLPPGFSTISNEGWQGPNGRSSSG